MFDEYLKQHGIKRRLSAPYTPQQNGISERKNRTLIEKARCILIDAKLPDEFWAEAINTANYLANRSPSRAINGDIPFKRWVGRNPSVRHLHIFGSKAFVLNKKPNRGKYSPKAEEGIFIGYSELSKAYRIYMPHLRQVIISRDVRVLNRFHDINETIRGTHNFKDEDNENHKEDEEFIILSSKPETEGNVLPDETEENMLDNMVPDESEENMLDNNTVPDETEEDFSDNQINEEINDSHKENVENNAPNTSRPQREIKPPKWTRDFEMSCLCNDDNSDENDEVWHEAIKNEIISHIKNETWTISDMKLNKKPIGCKLVLKNKVNPDGTLERRKARLVARGFTQQKNVDFSETFAPVVKLSTIRFLLGIASEENMNISQLDVSTAYLNGNLEEEIYMETPKNLEKYLCEIILEESQNHESELFTKSKKMLENLRKGKTKKVCKLQRSLYGLKQSGRQWFKKLDETLKNIGFKPSTADPCIYVCLKGGERVILAVYVDDILIASTNAKVSDSIKEQLMRTFQMRDLGNLKYCLGIEFVKTPDGFTASQQKYIDDLLVKYNMTNCKTVSTPMEPKIKLTKGELVSDSNIPYQNLIGSLMYLSVATRPDISFAVSYLSQFNKCFGNEHWVAAKRILRYLKGTKNLKLVFKKSNKQLYGLTDADWATSSEDRRSYTGYCFIYGGSCISWESRKQRTVALSTAEAEYMALTEAAKEAIHLKQLANDLHIYHEKIQIFNDNQAAQSLSINPIISTKSKHIDIKHHFIREAIENGHVKLEYKRSEEMEADILTKALNYPKHSKFRNYLGLCQLREGEC